MKTIINYNWQFAEIPLDYNSMYRDEKPVLFIPDDYYKVSQSQLYRPVELPHDWMIYHVKDLYKNSVGCYKKVLPLTEEEVSGRHLALHFEGVYMNSAVWVNGKKAGEWKYGYSTFEFDITDLVQVGENLIEVIAVYQNCNTRWYSGAGIFRDVTLINTPKTFLTTDGLYITSKIVEQTSLANGKWQCDFSVEVAGEIKGHTVRSSLVAADGKVLVQSETTVVPIGVSEEENQYLQTVVCGLKNYDISKAEECFQIENPRLWDVDDPYFYTAKVELLDENGSVIDSTEQNYGFKTSVFDKDKGYILNGRNIKIYGACHHHDHGAFGAAFNKNALRRQFNKLKEMGVNSVRCSHNPPPKAWMDLADEMGILVDDEAFDMWEKPKTQFDYGNYFNDWCERDTASWVRKDRNHPSLLMWSIGNEIYDTHMGNGFEITKRLYSYVVKNDPKRVAPITIASNYMMSEGAQHCATEIDTVGYNYTERLYNEHHAKYPEWKIYGSETSSTVQSRGIYHFPEELKLVTFSDGQCSVLGNCTTTWGCANTQTVIANDRDCEFSAGQYIWTGWDYIGEPTPYHSKNSYFGQIDTAGFEKDTFYLYKSEWAYKKADPFVHLLPYWDWNEGQIIDVKAYTNAESVELFFNGTSLGRQSIDHAHGKEPFGRWQLPYHRGEIKAVGYDENGNEIASDVKRSFDDPTQIILSPETEDTGDIFFVDVMVADQNGTLVENARNYITINVAGNGELIGLDNGDSTDYEEYVAENKFSHTRKLFSNRLVAIIKGKKGKQGRTSFVVTAASKDLPNVSIKYDGEKWVEAAPYNAVHAVEDFVPARKIEIVCDKWDRGKCEPAHSFVENAGSGSPVTICETNCEEKTEFSDKWDRGKCNNTADESDRGKCDNSDRGIELTPSHRELKVRAKVFPENATIKEIIWSPVLKECVSSDFIEVTDKTGEGTGVESATIKAVCDGQCILRCTAKNGSSLDEVISDLNFTVSGVGNPKLNPYKLIEACRLSDWNPDKPKPVVSLESGISNRGWGETWISFDKVDFGKEGADTIHLPIFSFATELPIEVLDGKPGEEKSLGKFTYKHESIYNTYSENVFVLNKRLFGVHTIMIVLFTDLVFHGFYFDQTLKALSKLRALDADEIVGDTFTKTDDAVVGIGNNVNLDFSNMDFGTEGARSLTICGKSNTDNNSINLKIFDQQGNVITQVIEFPHTDDYEEKSFDISEVTGATKVSFIFLPGCNFDFKWFKFC